jgi:hypothetical protein
MNKEEKKAVEDSKELIKEFNNHKDKNLIGSLYYKNKPIEEILKILLNLIEKLQEENKEKDKIIDLLIKELYTKAHISTRCYLQTSTEECMKYKNCYECLKKHFENEERRNNGERN